MKPCEGDTNNNEETFSRAAIADLSMDYELDLDEAEKSDESIKCNVFYLQWILDSTVPQNQNFKKSYLHQF
jgi:hypothetical protein